MVVFTSQKKKAHYTYTIIPQGIKDFCARRIGEALGIFIIALSGIIFFSLFGYNIQDPNINYINGNDVTNPFGYLGASVADIFIQFLGLGSFILVAIMIYFGIFMIIKEKEFPNYLRLFSALLICMMCSGLLTQFFGVNSNLYPTSHGGYVGVVFVGVFDSQFIGDRQFIFALLYIGVLMLLVSYTFRINIHNMTVILKLCIVSVFAFVIFLLSLPAKLLKYVFAFFTHKLPSDTSVYSRRNSLLSLLFNLTHKFSLNYGRTSQGFLSGISAWVGSIVNAIEAAKNEDKHSMSKTSLKVNHLHADIKHTPIVEESAKDKDNIKVKIPQIANEDTLDPLVQNYNLGDFKMPSINMLEGSPPGQNNTSADRKKIIANVSKLEKVLRDFGVSGDIVEVRSGPVVTLYELEPSPGVKSSRVVGLADDIARSMSAISTRVAVVSGKNAIGIELPNDDRQTVYLRELIANRYFSDHVAQLPLALGRDIAGEPVIADLARMPHLLIAGTTGSGKSVGINTMLLSLIYALPPQECRLILIDPKMLELSVYDDIPHLLTPVVTEPKKAVTALKWAVREMERRYKLMSNYSVRNLHGYNARAEKHNAQLNEDEMGEENVMEKLPYIVLVIDEMADLMMVAGKEIEAAVQRLAQMARAAGIHMITATQRPSVDVITGTIKANFPTRISFQVSSKIDSRTILGEQGAEQLLGQGDMLFLESGGRLRRVHGPFVSDAEVERVVNDLKKQQKPEYRDDVLIEDDNTNRDSVFDTILNNQIGTSGNSNDELYKKAVQLVACDRKASTSYIQRRLAIGYNKAASLIEKMEEEGLIGPADHAGRRDIYLEKLEN